MKRADKTGILAFIGVSLALAACGGKGQAEPAEVPAELSTAAALAEPGVKPADPAVAPADPAVAPAEPAAQATGPGVKPADPVGTAPAPAEAADADAGVAANADAGPARPASGLSYPGKNTIVRDPRPDTPEGVIAQALAAAMNADADAGWQQFLALLHTSEKEPNALISRRELNWPAMRRKVSLFLVEDPTKPIYKWAYAEEPGNGQIKVFVYNPKSMPTPCYVARDPEQENKWRIQTCSL